MIWCSKVVRYVRYYGFKKVSSRPGWLDVPVTHSVRRAYETEAKVVKDVMLYKYDNPRFYKYLNGFAVIQFLFWGFMGRFSVSSIRDVPVEENLDKNLPWWKRVNLGEGKYKNTLAIICYLFGKFGW